MEYVLNDKQNPLLVAVSLIVVIALGVVLMLMSFVAVKWKPFLRMKGEFHLVNTVICTLMVATSSTALLTSLSVFQGPHAQCHSSRLPFYFAVVAAILHLIAFFGALIIAGLASELRQTVFMEQNRDLSKLWPANCRGTYVRDYDAPSYPSSFRSLNA